MWRVIRWLIPLALITFGLLWPLVIQGGSEASNAEDPVVFSNYKADFVVNRDGRLDAVETITGEFPSGRHGIFQWWDIANQNNPGLRQKPEITSILLDGEPISYQMLWEGGERFRVAKIGDPDRTLSWGTHVFEIRYSIPGVLDPGTTGANKTFAAATGRTVRIAVGVLVGRRRQILEQQDRAGRHHRHAARRRRPRAVFGRARGGPGMPDDLTIAGDTVDVLGDQPCAAHPGDGAGRRRRADAAADEPAVVLRLGPHPRPVGHRRGVDRRAHSGIRARRVPVVPHHRRTLAGVPVAVRASDGSRAGADRIHPHRDRPEGRAHGHTVLPRRAQADRPATGQRQAVEHPRNHRRGRVGRRGSGEPRRRACTGGDPRRQRNSRPSTP